MSQYNLDQFDPTPDSELICCICQSVFDQPLQTPCQHVFCKICIETWLNSDGHNSCPSCRKTVIKVALFPVLPLLNNLINKLTMKCDNYNNGCKKLIPLEFINSHREYCRFVLMKCKFTNCGKEVLKYKIAVHEEICLWREILCKNKCKLNIFAKDVKKHNCWDALKLRNAENVVLIEKLKVDNNELTLQNSALEAKLFEATTLVDKLHEDRYRYRLQHQLLNIDISLGDEYPMTYDDNLITADHNEEHSPTGVLATIQVSSPTHSYASYIVNTSSDDTLSISSDETTPLNDINHNFSDSSNETDEFVDSPEYQNNNFLSSSNDFEAYSDRSNDSVNLSFSKNNCHNEYFDEDVDILNSNSNFDSNYVHDQPSTSQVHETNYSDSNSHLDSANSWNKMYDSFLKTYSDLSDSDEDDFIPIKTMKF